jgi:dCMP deaminase
MINWNKRFVEAASFFAKWSKDTSSKVGAVIYNPTTNSIVSIGYNGFPRGVYDSGEAFDLKLQERERQVGCSIPRAVRLEAIKKIDERNERPLKYKYTVHAETNAIYNAARLGTSLEGMGIALDWFPC